MSFESFILNLKLKEDGFEVLIKLKEFWMDLVIDNYDSGQFDVKHKFWRKMENFENVDNDFVEIFFEKKSIKIEDNDEEQVLYKF